MSRSVAILMATFNGALFLEEQIQSIRRQSYKNWVLLIRDDCSADGTVELLKKFAGIDSRIKMVFSQTNMGARENFNELLHCALDYEYIMFCDQDDVWFENKIESTLLKMRQIEANVGKNYPIMVFTDLSAVNIKMDVLASSYNSFIGLNISDNLLPRLIAQPFIFGCTIMVNQKLAKETFPIPKQAEMHDCWISLSASLIGEIGYIPHPTIYHRYHGKNASGESFQSNLLLRIKRFLKQWINYSQNTQLRLSQCQLLIDRFANYKKTKKYKDLHALTKYVNNGKIPSILGCVRYGVFRQGVLQSIAFYLSILLGPGIRNRKK